MALSKYRHGRILIENLPILEATSFKWDESSGHLVERTPAGQGVLPSALPVAIKGSFDVKIPRTGHEYDYRIALRQGKQIVIRLDDADGIDDCLAVILDTSKSDDFGASRSMTVNFEGSLIE